MYPFKFYPIMRIYPGLQSVPSRLILFNSYASCPFSSMTSISKKAIEDGVKKRNSIAKLVRVATTQKARISAGLAFLFVSSGVTLSVPYWLGLLIDQATMKPASSTGLMNSPLMQSLYDSKLFIQVSNFIQPIINLNEKTGSLLVILFGILTIGAVSNALRVFMFKTAGSQIGNRLRNCIFQSIVRNRTYSQYYRLSSKTGDLSSRMSIDVNIMAECSSQVISDFFRSISQLALGFGMMFYISTDLTLAACLAIPPMILMGKLNGTLLQETSRKTTEQLGEVTAFASERFYNLREVHASGQNISECNRFFDLNQILMNYNLNEAKARAIFFGAAGFIGNIILIGVISYGGNLVQNNILTIGELGSYLMYSGYVGVSITRISTSYAQLMKGLASSERIWQMISLKEFENNFDRIEEIKSDPGLIEKYSNYNQHENSDFLLEFKNVDFVYPVSKVNENANILNNINFNIKEGEVIAISGLSGSGKTTIFSLILKLFEPKNGEIFWKGHLLSEINADLLRNYLISPVLQENVLFNGTILENITYGSIDKNFDLERVKLVCETAQITDFVSKEKGVDLNFEVGERGNNLSGGQRQRVLIARALYKKCPLLLFDEATSAMDNETELNLFDALKRYRMNNPVTIISIAHRIATLKSADRIILLGRKRKEDVSATIITSCKFEELPKIADGNEVIDNLLNREEKKNL